MARTARLLVAVLAVAGLAGCAAVGSGSGSPVATAAVDLPPSYRFEPAAIMVPAGTTVTWSNHDNFSHSVRFLDDRLPGEPMLMQPGASATFTFSDAGTYAYECHLHPRDMTGSVTVTP